MCSTPNYDDRDATTTTIVKGVLDANRCDEVVIDANQTPPPPLIIDQLRLVKGVIRRTTSAYDADMLNVPLRCRRHVAPGAHWRRRRFARARALHQRDNGLYGLAVSSMPRTVTAGAENGADTRVCTGDAPQRSSATAAPLYAVLCRRTSSSSGVNVQWIDMMARRSALVMNVSSSSSSSLFYLSMLYDERWLSSNDDAAACQPDMAPLCKIYTYDVIVLLSSQAE